jgi:acyl-CoA synthetase (AMP-forming)/AMP-acid ligase II
VVFVEAIPIGATGKMLKTRLREELKDYQAAFGCLNMPGLALPSKAIIAR